MQNIKKNAQALADLIIGHCVELTFLEGKLGGGGGEGKGNRDFNC